MVGNERDGVVRRDSDRKPLYRYNSGGRWVDVEQNIWGSTPDNVAEHRDTKVCIKV